MLQTTKFLKKGYTISQKSTTGYKNQLKKTNKQTTTTAKTKASKKNK